MQLQELKGSHVVVDGFPGSLSRFFHHVPSVRPQKHCNFSREGTNTHSIFLFAGKEGRSTDNNHYVDKQIVYVYKNIYRHACY